MYVEHEKDRFYFVSEKINIAIINSLKVYFILSGKIKGGRGLVKLI